MSSVIKNDFTAGILSPRLYGRYNSAPYQNGCMRLKNWTIMPQGGITRRPGTLLKNTPDHSAGAGSGERAALAGSRLIPFCLKTDTNFIIELGNNCLRVWKQDASELMKFTYQNVEYTTLTYEKLPHLQDYPSVTSLYTTEEAEQVQYAQDYEHLYLAHRNHKPLEITYREETVGTSVVPRLYFSDFVPILQTQASEEHPDGDTDNAGFCTGNDCPGVVFYYASRLWFASSKAHPYRFWGARPFVDDNKNFEFYDVEEVANEGAKAETIENAVMYGILSIASSNSNLHPTIAKTTWEQVVQDTGAYVFIYDGTNWKLGNVTASLPAYGITYTGTPSTNDTITVNYYNVNEGTTKMIEVQREDNAIRLEVGSARNDEIKWMTSMGNYIVVGTASGEWLMPGNINGVTASTIQVSAYGSADHVQPMLAGNDIIYVQTGARHVRNYMGGSEGYSSTDLNFIAGELGTVKHMAFQRIPEPRLYAVMADGSLKVLFYDRQYALQGWAEYTFDGLVKDVCVTESSAGQTVYISILRNIGESTTRLQLEALNELDITSDTAREDCSNYSAYKKAFTSEVTTNTYEFNTRSAGSSLGKRRRIYQATFRVINTPELTVGYRYDFTTGETDPKYMESRTIDVSGMGMDDVAISLPGGYERFIAFTARVTGTTPATITALSLLIDAEA